MTDNQTFLLQTLDLLHRTWHTEPQQGQKCLHLNTFMKSEEIKYRVHTEEQKNTQGWRPREMHITSLQISFTGLL